MSTRVPAYISKKLHVSSSFICFFPDEGRTTTWTPHLALKNLQKPRTGSKVSNILYTTPSHPAFSQRQKSDPFFFAEAGGSGEESDVLSINADTYDSDIEGSKEEQAAVKAGASGGECVDPPANQDTLTDSKAKDAKKDIQSDIDRSVSEILALSDSSSKEEAKEQSAPPPSAAVTLPGDVGSGSGPAAAAAAASSQPSVQQLELLELEMRARAIKALMKASNGKKSTAAGNV